MKKDRLFASKRRVIKDFDFGKNTAAVFDDMLDRSVPYYGEILRMIGELVSDFAVEGTNVYDLGCSTGNTFLVLDPLLPKGIRFVGVDASAEMLKKTREKLALYSVKRPFDLVTADLNKSMHLSNASVVIMNLTLQFVRPMHRQKLIQSIAKGLNEHGCLILVEKVLNQDPLLNRLFIQHYYAYKKRNGYNRLEIAQKREALENVLIPYRVDENFEMLLSNGFRCCEVFFRWYNFCGIVALK